MDDARVGQMFPSPMTSGSGLRNVVVEGICAHKLA